MKVSELDLKVINGLIVDGTGAPPFEGDVGVVGDQIVAVGTVDTPSRQTIDARGLRSPRSQLCHQTVVGRRAAGSRT